MARFVCCFARSTHNADDVGLTRRHRSARPTRSCHAWPRRARSTQTAGAMESTPGKPVHHRKDWVVTADAAGASAASQPGGAHLPGPASATGVPAPANAFSVLMGGHGATSPDDPAAAGEAAPTGAPGAHAQAGTMHHGGSFANYMNLKVTKLREQVSARVLLLAGGWGCRKRASLALTVLARSRLDAAVRGQHPADGAGQRPLQGRHHLCQRPHQAKQGRERAPTSMAFARSPAVLWPGKSSPPERPGRCPAAGFSPLAHSPAHPACTSSGQESTARVACQAPACPHPSTRAARHAARRSCGCSCCSTAAASSTTSAPRPKSRTTSAATCQTPRSSSRPRRCASLARPPLLACRTHASPACLMQRSRRHRLGPQGEAFGAPVACALACAQESHPRGAPRVDRRVAAGRPPAAGAPFTPPPLC